MAAAIIGNWKNVFTISRKSRLDGLSDQYNRIFMVNLILFCTMIMGFSWYTDSIKCIVPKSHTLSKSFVPSACWIQGMYVYKQLAGRVDNDVAYYGMPKNMDHEGMFEGTKELCPIKAKLGVNPSDKCKPMTKTFFLQYQYMPFFVATLAILYYLPYIAFRTVNKDKQRLKDGMAKDGKTPEDIVLHHFRNFPINNKKQSKEKFLMLTRVLLNIVVKLLYILSNVVALLSLDNILHHEYIKYGSKFIKWARLENTIQYDYMGMREFPKPGNILLPPFGYCEMFESARDVKTTLANQHKFVCEISQNILYQYCLAVMWFAIVGGIIVSCCGLLHILLDYLRIFIKYRCGRRDQKDFSNLHLQEMELLQYIRIKDTSFYKQVKQLLPDKIQKAEIS